MKKISKKNQTKKLATELGFWRLILWSFLLLAIGVIFFFGGIGKLVYGELEWGLISIPVGITCIAFGIWSYKKIRKSM